MRKFVVVILLGFSLFGRAQSGDSIFELETVWKNQNGVDFQFKSLKGKKTIVGMVYTSCPHACPMTISKIKDIEKKIGPNVNYHVVLASFDPQRDTPPNLLKQIQLRKLDESKWTLLSPKNDQMARELSLILGISYKDLGDGNFSHSNGLTLFDEGGVKIGSLEGLNSDTAEFLKIINGK